MLLSVLVHDLFHLGPCNGRIVALNIEHAGDEIPHETRIVVRVPLSVANEFVEIFESIDSPVSGVEVGVELFPVLAFGDFRSNLVSCLGLP